MIYWTNTLSIEARIFLQWQTAATYRHDGIYADNVHNAYFGLNTTTRRDQPTSLFSCPDVKNVNTEISNSLFLLPLAK